MVEATSASMATGCPNKPRKAVQKEGKVSSSNVLDKHGYLPGIIMATLPLGPLLKVKFLVGYM